MGKVLKYILWLIFSLFLLVLLLPVLFYIPFIQNWAKDTATQYVTEKYEIEISIERLRLSFPFDLVIDNSRIVLNPGDTLFSARSLRLDVALSPLLNKEIKINKLLFSDVKFSFADTTSNMEIDGNVERLILSVNSADLKTERARIPRLILTDGWVNLKLGESPPDTTQKKSGNAAWAIDVKKLSLNNIDFGMQMYPQNMHLTVHLGKAMLQDGSVDLGHQTVDVNSITIDQGIYSYLTDTVSVTKTKAEQPTDSIENSEPWVVKVSQIKLTDNQATYGLISYAPQPGFDLNYISATNINITVDSLYNRGAEVKADLRHLSLTERSGLSIVQSYGSFSMDSTALSLRNFILQTANSSISANAHMGMPGTTGIQARTPLSAHLKTDFGPEDLYLLYPDMRKQLGLLPIEKIHCEIDADGDFGSLNIPSISASIPGRCQISANGKLQTIYDMKKISGNVHFNGDFTHMGFITDLLPDTLLQKRINIPDNMHLYGSAKISGSKYYPDIRFTSGGGSISLNGLFDPQTESYDIKLISDSLSVAQFLPYDSIGVVSLRIAAAGKGFNFFSTHTHSDISLKAERIDYKKYTYNGISISAALLDQKITGEVVSTDSAAQINLGLKGFLSKERYEGSINGSIKQINFQKMGFSPTPLALSFDLEAKGAATEKGAYEIDTRIGQMMLTLGDQTNKLNSLIVTGSMDNDHIKASITGDDLQADFSTTVGIDTLTSQFAAIERELEEQQKTSKYNIYKLEQMLPSFSISASAKTNKFIKSLLKSSGIGFKEGKIAISDSEKDPFMFNAAIDRFETGGIRVDTIRLTMDQHKEHIDYNLHIGNAPGNLDQAAQVGMSGYIETNHVLIQCHQRNRAGQEGFDFGMNAWLRDSLVHVSILPDPILGFEPWTVNNNNFFNYYFDNRLSADLEMKAVNKSVVLRSADEITGKQGSLNVLINGLDIASILSISPFAPPIGGILSTDLVLFLPEKQVEASGNLSIENLSYVKQRVGDILFDINYQLDNSGKQIARADMSIDKQKVLNIDGSYDGKSDNPIDLTVSIPGFPLASANAFLQDMATLSGNLNGEMKISGTGNAPIVDGYLQFASTGIAIPMIGTSFSLSTEKIIIKENDLLFNKFAIIGPNKKPLQINGHVDMHDFSRMMTDLSITANEFQMVNVSRNRKSMVYGKAFADLNITVKGPIEGLSLRGDVGLLNGTDVTYVMQDSPLDIKQENQNMVTFVSFNDTTEVEEADTMPVKRISGMDILVNVNIANSVKVAVNLSADGQNRINLQGGGNLTYSMNTLGDSRFTGRYELTGGTVRYNPPIISEKIFNIQQGSYVSWTGNIADPAMNITAIEPLRISVSEDGKNTRTVNFNVSINIRNTLENLAITFDVSAPEDLTIQNELQSMTAEQRATQAMNLMIYNTYTGPGSETKGSLISGNPLNSFIQKELNQWAQNNLKNVDVSFGIDTYDDQTAGANGTRTDYSYQVSKTLFNDRFKVVIGGSFSPDDDANQNLKENLIDDVSLEYMLDKRENMLIKIFRHTGYESILEGEITETGVGFVVRKKLFRLSELFRISRKPKQNTK